MPTPPPPEGERKQDRGTDWVFVEMLCTFLAVSGVNMKRVLLIHNNLLL
jgi:hypothetical protein